MHNVIKSSIGIIALWLAAAVHAENTTGAVPYSQNPPGGLKPEQCPMFVSFGFDDNGFIDGINWFADMVRNKKNPAGSNNPKTFDNKPVRATFFITAGYGAENVVNVNGQTAEKVIACWKGVAADGHEIANHTYKHPHGASFNMQNWKDEMANANKFFNEKLGLPQNSIKGFRTPFLEISTGTYEALKDLNFYYDCSVEAGYGSGWTGDGTDGMYWWGMGDPKTRKKLFWPYTLDNGPAPGVADVVKPKISSLKLNGLWELTVYTFLRSSGSGEITGFDFNLWKSVSSSEEFYNTLKYNFDLQHGGNRCPFTVNAHTDYYSQYNADADSEFKASYTDRRAAIEKFLNYVMTFSDVRVVSYLDVISWMKQPTALGITALNTSAGEVLPWGLAQVNAVRNGISVHMPKSGEYSIGLVASNGRMIQQIHKTFIAAGKPFELSAPSAGVYLLQISDGIHSETRTFVTY